MREPGWRLAAFIALSAAGHAAVLLVGNRPQTPIGPEGRPVQVTMSYLAGATSPASPAVNSPGPSHAGRKEPHGRTPPTPVGRALRRQHENPPPESAAAQPLPAPQAEEAPAPGQAAAASAGTDTARQSSGEQLRRHILQLVHSRFNYPVLARRKGWQGIVKLEVHIESDGRISRLRVQETSGYPVLDRAALQSLRLASVPDAEQWMQGQALDIIIPVEYRLVGG